MSDFPTPNDVNQAKPSQQDQNTFQSQGCVVPQAQQGNAYIVFSPQLYQQNQIQYPKNQVQPIMYPQFQQPQIYLQQPLLQPQQQTFPQPQIAKNKDTLKHEELSKAGYMERRHFNLTVLKYYLIFQAFPLVLCICSYKNDFVKFSYNLNGYFQFPFYFFVSIMGLALLNSYTSHKKLRDKQLKVILTIFYGLSYGFFLQAIYSSTYIQHDYYESTQNNYGNKFYQAELSTQGNSEIVIILLCFLNLETYSLFSYSMQEVEELSIKNSFWYVILPTLTFGGILFSLYYNYGLLCLMIAFGCFFGFYLLFTLKRMQKSKKFKLRSDEGAFASVLFSFLILVPFFELEIKSNQVQAEITQSENSEQKNVQ